MVTSHHLPNPHHNQLRIPLRNAHKDRLTHPLISAIRNSKSRARPEVVLARIHLLTTGQPRHHLSRPMPQAAVPHLNPHAIIRLERVPRIHHRQPRRRAQLPIRSTLQQAASDAGPFKTPAKNRNHPPHPHLTRAKLHSRANLHAQLQHKLQAPAPPNYAPLIPPPTPRDHCTSSLWSLVPSPCFSSPAAQSHNSTAPALSLQCSPTC
jgi:hypothetical protein